MVGGDEDSEENGNGMIHYGLNCVSLKFIDGWSPIPLMTHVVIVLGDSVLKEVINVK